MKHLALALLLGAAPLPAAVTIEASGELPSSALDGHGDTIGGIGSGLIYDAANDTYLCVSDRGPGDGTLPYSPRYVTLKLTQDGDKLTPHLLAATIFCDTTGHPMTGLVPDDLSAQLPLMKDGRTCIDPEAIALAPDGTLYVSDEYGPYLYQFQRDGRMIRRLEMPADFQPREKDGRLNFTNTAHLVSGRNINQGAEGMCLLPDGKTVALAFQSGLVQEGKKKSPTTNILLLDLATGAPRGRYLYPFATEIPNTGEHLKNKRLSVNDLAPLSNTRFLVLERDGLGRDGSLNHEVADYKAVWVADLANATNILTPPTSGQPVPVAKALLYNLPALVPDPAKLAAKWEGITVIRHTPGSVELMMSADNDFLSPMIHESGQSYPFPRTKDAVPTQFFKIRADLPEKP